MSESETPTLRETIERSLFQPLNSLADECKAIAADHGFYEEIDPAYLEIVLPLMLDLGGTMAVLEWSRKDKEGSPLFMDGSPPVELDNDRLYVALKLLLIASEVTEVFEAIVEENGKEAEEVADIAIRLFDYASYRGIDLDMAVAEKMEKNRQRPHKHGARF